MQRAEAVASLAVDFGTDITQQLRNVRMAAIARNVKGADAVDV